MVLLVQLSFIFWALRGSKTETEFKDNINALMITNKKVAAYLDIIAQLF